MSRFHLSLLSGIVALHLTLAASLAAAEVAPAATPATPTAAPAVAKPSAQPPPSAAAAPDELSETSRQFFKPMTGWSVFGLEAWRLIATTFLLMVALILNGLIRYSLRKHIAARETEDTAAPPQSIWSLFLATLHLPSRIIVWGVTLRLFIPLFVPEQSGVGLWIWQVMLSIGVAVLLYELVDVAMQALLRHAATTEHKGLYDTLIPMLRKTLRILVIVLAGLQIYNSVTGQSITTILAGLGLGGVAFALAAQDSLKNMFGFVSLIMDRPYVVGERIIFGDHDGVVESVSFRSTRLRKADGSLVSIPNAHAVSSVILNPGRSPFVHRILNLTLTRGTTPEKIESAVALVREILANHEGMKPGLPPRVFFNDFNADSLNLVAHYWYHPADGWKQLAHAEKVNLEILRRFRAAGIELSFPTRTVVVEGGAKP